MSSRDDVQSHDRFDRRLREALEAEAVGRAPDRILEGVFAQTQSTPQARRWGWRGLAPTPRSSGRAWLLIAAGVLMLAVVGSILGAGGFAPLQPTSSPVRPSPSASPGLVACDGGSGLMAESNRLWVSCRTGIQPIELSGDVPRTGVVIADVGLPVVGPAGLFAPSPSGIVELDPTGRSIRRTLQGAASTMVAVGRTVLWTASIDAVIRALDPADGRVIGTVRLDAAPLAMLANEDQLWVALADGTVRRYDGAALVPALKVAAGGRPARLAISSRDLFVLSTAPDGLLTRIDLRSGSTRSVSVADPSDPPALDLLTANDTGVWVSRRDRLIRVDPASLLTMAEVPLPAYPSGIAVTEDTLWVVEAGGRIDRFDLR